MQTQPPATENGIVTAVTEPQNTWAKLVPKVISVVNFSAALTIAGFFVIHSYIATFTQIFTYNISVTQYLAAGINLVLAILWNIILPIVTGGIILAIIWVGCYLVWKWAILRIVWLQRLQQAVLGKLSHQSKRILPVLRISWRIYNFITGLLFILLVLAISFIYGSRYYALSPRALGGGMPAEVILVFKEPQATGEWPFLINSKILNQSEKIQLLLELTDGLLVRDEQNKIPIIVKNDVLQAIIDYTPPTFLSTSTNVPTTIPTTTP